MELMKQGNYDLRIETAKLIDSLSLGVALNLMDSRIKNEIAFFINKILGKTNLITPASVVWCKVAYIFGFFQISTAFDKHTKSLIQREVFRRMWNMTFGEFIEKLGDSKLQNMDRNDAAENIHKKIIEHAHEVTSFKSAYSNEIRGIIRCFGDYALDYYISMIKQDGIEASQKERDETINIFVNALTIALAENKENTRDMIRTLHILGCLHATLRNDKGAPFSGNHLYDFEHSAAALAYCNAFLTENSLRSIVTQKNTALDKSYNCHVVSKIDDAIVYIKTLL